MEQENSFMKYVINASELYYGLSRQEVETFAYEYAKMLKALSLQPPMQYPAEWDTNLRASNDWYYGFMHRHPQLSLRTPDQISANRAKGFCAINVKKFIDNLSDVLDAGKYQPQQIWNMDETSCSTVPTKPVKVIAKKGSRRVGQKTSGERGSNVTMALAIDASVYSSILCVSKEKYAKNFFGSDGVASESGWMNSIAFINFMKHFVTPSHASKSNPTLLILDGHTSHLSVAALDVALATVDIARIPQIIKTGFRASGIFPFNSYIFTHNSSNKILCQNCV